MTGLYQIAMAVLCRKSTILMAQPKTADHKVKHPFQLIFTDMMEPITQGAIGGYKYISKISSQHRVDRDVPAEVQRRRFHHISIVSATCSD